MDEVDRRLILHRKFKAIPLVKEVYFDPPSNTMMIYPAIVYNYQKKIELRANNKKYLSWRNYNVIIIDENPDSRIPLFFEENFINASLDRPYTLDNMYHWAYSLFF